VSPAVLFRPSISFAIFFSFSTARHDILTRFYESIYSHVREVGFPSTVLQAKSKNQILQPSAKQTQFFIGVALEFLTSISEIIFVICASII
jgi:hypothetical protein